MTVIADSLAKKVKPKPLGEVRQPARDLDLGDVKIYGERGAVANIRRNIASANLQSTIEGASTLTFKVRDHDRAILRSSVVTYRSVLTLDNIEYTLVKVSHQGDEVTLIFEESAVNWMRQYKKPKKANRDNTTRAQFIQGMVREVKERTIAFYCPEVNERQQIAKSK
jgi:hypothetical protein